MSYTEFDRERIISKNVKDWSPHKDHFERDRESLICTTAFRRLQGKTQVFQPGTHLHRTRLTHSMEVSMVGRALTSIINARYQAVLGDFRVNPDLVEFACLAHDLGNPPVGHVGERLLNRLMVNFGGFEGNAQTLRLIADVIDWPEGIKPTRATLDSVIKYPRFFDPKKGVDDKKFLYQYHADLLSDIREGCPEEGQSIECQIMDLADDVVNACADYVDGVRSGIINDSTFMDWKEEVYPTLKKEHKTKNDSLVKWLGEIISNREAQAGFLNRFCNRNLVLTENSKDLAQVRLSSVAGKSKSQRFSFKLEALNPAGAPYLEEKIEILKSVRDHIVLSHSSVREKERFASFQLAFVFKALEHIYCVDPDSGHIRNVCMSTITSFEFDEKCSEESEKSEKMRLICDFISSMTDPYLQVMYGKFEDPKIGLSGIVELSDVLSGPPFSPVQKKTAN